MREKGRVQKCNKISAAWEQIKKGENKIPSAHACICLDRGLDASINSQIAVGKVRV